MANPRPRSPLLAVLLSVLEPGLGHLYCGKTGCAVVLLALGLLLSPFVVLAFFSPASPTFGIAALTIFASFAIVWVGVAVDAWRVARKLGACYEPKRYNRWPVYAFLILLPVPVAMVREGCVREKFLQALLFLKNPYFLNPPRPRADACSGRDDGERRKGEERNGG